jgi:DNA invertase Pin-like site-specific DNA recombinase
MTKAFAYLRVSGKGQLQGDGFTRQMAAIKDYAAKHDIRIVNTFREKGVCGENELEDRPALLELLEALASNGVKLVLIEKLDRLARDLMVQETLISDLQKRGFELISVMEPDLLQNDPTRILMRQIFGAIAQYEKAMIVAKLRGARQRMKQREGKCEGRKAYGEHPGEEAILERMKALHVEGVSFNRIAQQLNAENITPRGAQRWSAWTVNQILSRRTALLAESAA